MSIDSTARAGIRHRLLGNCSASMRPELAHRCTILVVTFGSFAATCEGVSHFVSVSRFMRSSVTANVTTVKWSIDSRRVACYLDVYDAHDAHDGARGAVDRE